MDKLERIKLSAGGTRAQIAALAAITLIAAGLRFYKLGDWSFWYDEIYTLRAIGALPGTTFTDPGISKALIALAVNALGNSEWAARLVPALIGVLTVPVLYFLVRDLYNGRTALIASLLLGVSTWHLYWSQNARFYTTLLLFSTLALVAFYHGIEKDRLLNLVLFLVFLGLAVRERMFAVILLPIAALYLVCLQLLPFEKPPGLNRRNLLLLGLPVVLIGAVVGWIFLQDLPGYLAGFGTVNSDPIWILSGAVYYIGIPVILMGAAGGIYRLTAGRDRATLLFSIAALLPMLAVASLALIQYAANRYIFISLTSWIVLAGVAAEAIYARVQGSSRILAAGVFLILLLEPLSEDLLYFLYQNGNRDDWKAAFQRIEEEALAGDLVVVTEPLLGDYYLNHEVMGIESLAIESIGAMGRRIWFVEDNNLGTKSPHKLGWLEEHARLVANYDVDVRARVFKMRLYLYEPESTDRSQ
jgi:hypothetical protein